MCRTPKNPEHPDGCRCTACGWRVHQAELVGDPNEWAWLRRRRAVMDEESAVCLTVDYDLLAQEIDTLCNAMAALDEDSPYHRVDRIQEPIDIGHLEGIHGLLGAIFDRRPFPESKDEPQEKPKEEESHD
jgi:hypothetical protein